MRGCIGGDGMGKATKQQDPWRARWRKADEILKIKAIPTLGKIPGGKKTEADLLTELRIIAQEFSWSYRDDGGLEEVRTNLKNIAEAAAALAEALRTAKPGVFGTLFGVGLDEPIPWSGYLRTAGTLRCTDIMVLDGTEVVKEPPGMGERCLALSKAANLARNSLLPYAKKGGLRGWHELRRGTPKLDLMRACLLFLVDHGIKWERRLKPLARAIVWAVEGQEQGPADNWGTREYRLTKTWWKELAPYYGAPEDTWPDGIRKLYLQGPFALQR